MLPRPGGRGKALRSAFAHAASVSACATRWMSSPSNLNTAHSRASHNRMARAAIVSNTGCTSVGDRLMTPRISLVAVCCSKASFVSLNSRTFSIAMTAWSAKVWSSAICLSVKAWTSPRRIRMAPSRLAVLQERRGEDGPAAGCHTPRQRLRVLRRGHRRQVVDVDGAAFDDRSSGYGLFVQRQGKRTGDDGERAAGAGEAQDIAVTAVNDRVSGPADPHRGLRDGSQHRFQIRRRAGDQP